MAFTGDGQPLVGSYGTVYSASLGPEESGDGATALDAGLYLITAVGSPTGWPASADAEAADITAGYIVRVRDADVITPETGDSYKELPLTERCDADGWNISVSADELETTTFCDAVKTYVRGKIDISGSISGKVKIGTTTGPDGFTRSFLDVVQQDGDTSIDLYEQTNEILFAYLVANKDLTYGDEVGVFFPINIYSTTLGAAQDAVNTFDGSIRVATFPGIKPALYRFSA